jgi:hypothetical protein
MFGSGPRWAMPQTVSGCGVREPLPAEPPAQKKPGCLWRTSAVIVTLLFAGLVAGAVGLVVHQDWRQLAVGLPDLGVWGWLTISLWRPSDVTALSDGRLATPGTDPGWPKNLIVVVRLLPGAMLRPNRPPRPGNLLLALRSVTLAFCAALLLFASTIGRLALQQNGLPNGPVLPWLALLVLLAAPNLIVDRVLSFRSLDCSSSESVATAYRALFLVRIAFATSIALYGFVLSFIGPAWIYFPALVLALVRISTGVAPTRSLLARDQRRMHSKGCDRLLLDSLTASGVGDH